MAVKRDPSFLNTTQAARYVGCVSSHSLRRWRSEGRGPSYLRVGRNIFYRVSDLDTWVESQIHIANGN